MNSFYKYGSIIIILLSINCRRQLSPENLVPMKAVSLFSIGDVTYGTETVTAGNVFESGKIFKTGSESIAEIQMIKLNPEAIIRLKPGSQFEFKKEIVDNKESAFFILKFGEGVFDIKKLKSEDSIIIAGPSFQAGVRGTKFITSVDRNSDSKTELLEGSLAITPSIPELENYPKKLLQTSKSLQKIDQYLKNSEIILEKNQSIKTNKSDIDKFSAAIDLPSVLNLPAIAALKGKTNPTESEIVSAASSIDSAFEDKARSEKLNSALSQKINYSKESLSEASINSKIKEFEDLLKIEQKKLEETENKAELVKTFNKSREQQLLKRMGEILNLEIKTVKFPDGKMVKGLILRNDKTDKGTLLTIEGRKEFDANESEILME